jgi:alpha-tubulin suppressor-like RCC1 family protein
MRPKGFFRGLFLLPVLGLLVAGPAAVFSPPPGLHAPSDLLCWGDNTYGQLGNGANSSSDIPLQVSSLGSVVAVSACNEHTLALKEDGTVWAWGSNSSGQLGTNMVDASNIPLQVSNLDGVVDIAAGTG